MINGATVVGTGGNRFAYFLHIHAGGKNKKH